MDTVSMLNKMSFYCQPILPLVYDESMSYYETLCKVVGQLNTTGDAVNKLNEGLTGEIADRQKADSLLNERLKVLEATNKKIHFLAFAGTPPHSAGLIGTAPTRSELRQWVNNNELIITLLQTTDEERNVVYAASCAYNAGNWTDETSDDFNILVPIHTSYDADKDHAISQKVAKITIPPSSQTSLDAPWGLQFIEINTPSTSADGVVNFAANIFQDGHMECNLTPFEFMNLYAPTWANRNLCVAVNAKLFYDGYTRTSSIATLNSSNHIIRIAFERDHGTFINNGVKQLNKTIDYIIGDVSYNTWTRETIDSKTFDFSRYEGFQFTRGAHNVITANDESTPNAVYTQYKSDTSGKIYQNLPVRLVDTVDNAEYWNGVFDIKDNKHMTFTFVTSNYATASDKMAVRVIELSADVDTTTWKYAEKEFTLPLSGGSAPTYVDFWGTGQSEVYDNGLKGWTVSLGTDKTFDYIFDLISSGANVVARLYMDSTKAELVSKSMEANISGDKTLGFINFLFMHAADDVAFGFTTIADAIWVTKTSAGTSAYALYKWCALPAPTGDGTDNGKVPIINGTKWELKAPPSGSSDAVLYTPQTLTEAQKKQARDNIDAEIADFVVNATVGSGGGLTLDKTFTQIREAVLGGKRVLMNIGAGVGEYVYAPLLTSTASRCIFAVTVGGNGSMSLRRIYVSSDNTVTMRDVESMVYNSDGSLPQAEMDSDPISRMQIATKQYVDAHAGGGSSVTVDTAMSDASTNAVQNKVIKKYVDDHSSSSATKVTLSGTVEGEVSGYTSATYQEIVNEIAKSGNIWLTIGGESVRLASWKLSGASTYTLVFFGSGDGALTVKYEVTASASSASLTVTGS